MSSAPRSARWNSRASSPARWTRTARCPSRACTCPTSTPCGCRREDRERYEGVEQEVIEELCAYLLEHARREELILASPPHIVFHTDEQLALGEFGIQARLARADEPGRRAPCSCAQRGARPHDDLQHLRARRRSGPAGAHAAPGPSARCWRSTTGACWSLPRGPRSGAAATATSCSTTPASRAAMPRCARPRMAGRRGPRLHQRRACQRPRAYGCAALAPGDRLELGSTEIVFELG